MLAGIKKATLPLRFGCLSGCVSFAILPTFNQYLHDIASKHVSRHITTKQYILKYRPYIHTVSLELNMLKLPVGHIDNFDLEEASSEYLLPQLKAYFSEEMASFYQPVIYKGNQFFDTEGDDDRSATYPQGIYYRMVYNPSKDAYCIQYYVYWLKQNCSGFIGISNHVFDYEPIFVFVKPPNPIPFGIVNSGQSKASGLKEFHCRFHKTEVRMSEYFERDIEESPTPFKTSPSPFYPFGGESGLTGKNCVKKYPLPGSIYFENYKPLFGIDSCFHAFSGAEGALKGERLNVTLQRLDDKVLKEWFWDHHKEPDEEPFGHDVSNPFEFPFIKYIDPKPLLRS